MMTSPDADEVISLIVDSEAHTLTATGQQWHVPRPADLVACVAANFPGRWLHLTTPGAVPDRAGLAGAVAVARAQQADAVIGRVADANGRLSSLVQRLPALTYCPVAAGALVVSADALVRHGGACLGSVWDTDWPRDLALSLWWSATIIASDRVLARGGHIPAPRLPPQRATLFADPLPGADRTILVYGRIGASTSLYFDALAAAHPGSLRFLEPGDLFSDLPALAAAGLVIVVRGFDVALANGAVALLQDIGTPIVWFTDDDYMALAGEVAGLADYDADAIGAFAKRLAAIVTTSAPLAATLGAFHRTILTLPPVIDPALLARRPAAPLADVAAIVGGPFRARSLREHILPAAARMGLRLTVPSPLARAAPGARVMPFAADFRQFVPMWQREAPSLLLHPYGETANIGNKSVATLLCAVYFGAVPLVGDEPAYAGLGEDEGVFKAGRDPQDWHRQLRRLADPDLRQAAAGRLLAWAQDACSIAAAQPAFSALLAMARPDGRFAAEARLSAAIASATLQRTLPRQSPLVTATNRLMASARRRLRRWQRRG